MLDEVYRRSWFRIPLDGSGETFRYNHLFSEVPYYRLRVEEPEAVDERHPTAARWLLQHRREEEAVGRLLDADGAVCRPARRRPRAVADVRNLLERRPSLDPEAAGTRVPGRAADRGESLPCWVTSPAG